MLTFRPGVSLWNLQPQGVVILFTVAQVFEELLGPSVECRCNFGSDGEHMPGSYHGQGLAFDFSIAPVISVSKVSLAAAIAQRLGGSGKETSIPGMLVFDGGDFDVIVEDLGGLNEHLHVEWDRIRATARQGKPQLEMRIA